MTRILSLNQLLGKDLKVKHKIRMIINSRKIVQRSRLLRLLLSHPRTRILTLINQIKRPNRSMRKSLLRQVLIYNKIITRSNPNFFIELHHWRKLIELSLRPMLLRRDERHQTKPSRINKLLQLNKSQQRRILFGMKLRNKRKQKQKISDINRTQRRKIMKQTSSRPSWKRQRSRLKRQCKRSVSV